LFVFFLLWSLWCISWINDLMWQSVSLVVCGGGLVLLQAVWYFSFLVAVCNSGFCLLEGICFPALLWPSWACILLVRLIVSSCTVAVYHKLFFLFIFSSSHSKEWSIYFAFSKQNKNVTACCVLYFFRTYTDLCLSLVYIMPPLNRPETTKKDSEKEVSSYFCVID
jgi:hypothetical protein